jgi:hypothetical protein
MAAAEYRSPSDEPTAQVIESVFQVPDAALRDRLLGAMYKNSNMIVEAFEDAIANASIGSDEKRYALQIIASMEAVRQDASDQ